MAPIRPPFQLMAETLRARRWDGLLGERRNEPRRMKMQLLSPPETQNIGMTTAYENNTPALFKCWEEISTRIRQAREIWIYLDFDGTLVHYTPRPDQIKVEQSTETALRNLVRHSHVHVAIISGRRRLVLARYLKIPELEFMGLYG